jgi:hypothetical protein
MEMKRKDDGLLEPRTFIALIITVLVTLITIFIAIYQMFWAEDKDISFIGQSLLPLWGTWIGTVLAFYFGKANFDAATKSYQEVIRKLTPEDKMAQISANSVMIPFKEIEYLQFEDEMDKSLSVIFGYDRFKPYGRYAIIDNERILKYIIHKSTFHQYIVEQIEKGIAAPDIMGKTLQAVVDDILRSADNKMREQLLRGANFVSASATLLDAQKAMNAIAECQDVFVTGTGKSSEPILGLVTNNLILEKLQE